MSFFLFHMVPPQRKPPSCTCTAAMSPCDFYIHWRLMNPDLHWSSETSFQVAASYAQSEEFLLEMHILRERRFDGILYAVGLTFTQPICWGGGFKWCAAKCPLNISIFFPSFLFHFKPYSGNCLWFKVRSLMYQQIHLPGAQMCISHTKNTLASSGVCQSTSV